MGRLMSLMTMAAAALVTAALLGAAPMASGQASSVSCTVSLLTSFTPCFSFLTNSSSNGSPPTRECCRSLAALLNASTGCACGVLTGAVPLPLGVPINRTLAVSLPKACDSTSVPLQCRDTSSAQSPAAAGPVAADTPSTPATTAPEAPAPPTTTADPTATAPVSQRPTVLPSSARRTTTSAYHVAVAPAMAALLLAVAAALV